MRSAVRAFLRRDAQVALSYRIPFLLEAAAALFVLVTYSLVGHLVEEGTVPGGYFSFVAIGLAVTAFLQAGLSVLAANFRQEQVQGTLEAVVSSGVPTRALAAGMAAYPMANAAVRVVVYALIGAALGARAPGGNWGLALGATALGSVAFAGLGLVAAALVVTIRQAQSAVGLLVGLLALGAGSLFPPSLLPGWAESLAQASPVTHALRLTRDGLLEGASWSASAGRLGLLAVLAVVYAALGVAALAGSLGYARRRGGLGEY